MKTDRTYHSDNHQSSMMFILLMGVVSLLADMTHEGARSVTGPFLSSLGANASMVGIIAGFGELVGYVLRLPSGLITDRTGRYWTVTTIGYIVNVLAVPFLALAGRWEVAAFLIVLERAGKAIRNPVRDAMLSHATLQVGRGWGFGLHEAMDQIGAMLGPLIVAGVLFFKGTYRTAFAALIIPALLTISMLLAARMLYPRPRDLEPTAPDLKTKGLPRLYWIYLAAMALNATGYADFPLIAYHFQKMSTVSGEWIPVFYAVAMGVDAAAALLFGRFFDRKGIPVLIITVFMSVSFAPLVFLGGFSLCLIGMAFWGVGIGAQESIMRAAIAGMVPVDKRATAYGIFNTGYGVFWFVGSALLGILYDLSLPSLIAFSMATQIASVPLLLIVKKISRLQGRIKVDCLTAADH
ncbi:MAG: Major Facilitator Superfamily protein [Syntrophorhabdus sp. PtaU1.Bin058]|nr:MAG: Major Facilitator Superfamily protein [Syntrophorhabdus sp. PtaU1.Bin058]